MADEPTIERDPSGEEGQGGLMSPSFLGLLSSQTLTAINDNTFRWLVIGIGKTYVDPSHHPAILMAGTACFVLPYLFLAVPAGYLADRFSKRSVIVGCKVLEAAIMALGILAITLASLPMLLIAVAMMGAQSTLFSPSRLGTIPETLKSEKISTANGLMALATVIATVVGMAGGNLLADFTNVTGEVWLPAVVLIGIALIGTIGSLFIESVPAANPERPIPWNFVGQTYRDLRMLSAQPALLRMALGMTFFWSLGGVVMLNIDQFAFLGGATRQSHIVPLLLTLVGGVGIGSVLAGIWSRGRVELGLLPLGAAGLAISGMLLWTVRGDWVHPDFLLSAGYVWAAILLFVQGVSGGLFAVPLEAFLQHHSEVRSRGSVLAAANFLTFGGVLVSSILYYGLRQPWLFKVVPVEGWEDKAIASPQGVFFLLGLGSIPVLIYIIVLIPQTTLRFVVWLGSNTLYKIRIAGRDNLPARGGALLVSNYISWLDAALFLLTSSRPVRIIAWSHEFHHEWTRKIARFWGVILVGNDEWSVRLALRQASRALRNGELVVIIPQRGFSSSPQMPAFQDGLVQLLKRTEIPLIPVYLDELGVGVFSIEGEEFLWKPPRQWRHPISIHFGEQIDTPEDAYRIRRAILDLGASAVDHRIHRMTLPIHAFVTRCKQRKRKGKVADSVSGELSGGALLARTLVLRRLLRRHVVTPDEQHVGILLPPSIGALAANMALSIDRRVAVNLNYTVSSGVLNECIEMSNIRHVLTSRKFMEKFDFKLNAEIVYLEDFREKVTKWDKISAAWNTYCVPYWRVAQKLKLHKIDPDDVLTVIFTSGSTGTPKGVMLTHANIASNVEAVEQVIHLTKQDVIVGILPFFHSFGYTITMWTVVGLNVKGAYHFSPLDPQQVGKLCQEHKGTVFLATPTFLRTYLRRCTKEQLGTLDTVVAGAEKLPADLAGAFEEKFGVRPVEGYGCTELSPLVSVNVPPSRSKAEDDLDLKEGTVGRPVPGVSAKVTDLETGEELGADQPGMLWISGPNVMKGYLGRDDLTAEAIQDGWYKTGDVAVIDTEGFIKITGRESRFSKIAGEMVPHIKIEEKLNEIIGIDEEGGIKAAVTAVDDAKKGERLVVVHTKLDKSPAELCKGLADAGFPNIFIPSESSFVEVDEVPVLGSGKLDLKKVKQIAQDRFGGSQ